MGDLVEDMCGWQDLPAGVLQVIASKLIWSDMLSSRLVCAHWRAATATVITQLRVHVAPGCSNTAVDVKFEFQSCNQGAQDTAVQALQNRTAAVLAAQQNPGRVLATVLQQLPRVTAVQLVLTEHTSARDLEDVLAVVGQQPKVHDVTIWEVDPIYKSAQARSYAASLQLHKLRHVRHVTIRSSVTWSLQDIWQQVAAMATSSSSSSSSGSGSNGTALQGSKQGTMYPDVSSSDYVIDNCSSGGSSGSVAVVQQPDASSSSTSTQQQHQFSISTHPALASLTVQSVSLLSQGRTCSIPSDAAFPPHLQQLTTPLPGQHNSSGAIVCTIQQSHAQYARRLAAALPQLECLKMTGHYEGEMEPFKSMVGLTELQMAIGGLMWSMLQASSDDNSSSELDAGHAKQLLHLPKLQNLALETTYGAVAPVRLDWLHGAKQLRHLAAYVDPTAPVPGAASVSQLQSLTCRLLPNMPLGQAALLWEHIVAVGGQLTQLSISRGDPSNPTTRRPSRIQRPSLSLQPHLPSFTNLASLSLLSGPERMPFTIQEPAGVWQRLPLLRELRLQGVGLGYNANGALPKHKLVVAVPEHTPSGLPLGLHGTSGVLQSPAADDPTTSVLQQQLEEYLILWQDDLPPNLQKLELIRYVIVCRGQQQQQQQQQEGTAVSSSGTGSSSSSSSGQGRRSSSSSSSSGGGASCLDAAFGSLECLSLAACCVVQVIMPGTPTRQPAGSRSATIKNGAVKSIPAAIECTCVQLASPVSLMQRVPPSCAKLRELHLIQVPFTTSDVQCICDELSANLQLLRLQPADWCDSAGPVMQGALAKNAAAHAAALAVAAESGKLRQLRSLSLDFSNMLSCGWSPLASVVAAGSASRAGSGSSSGSGSVLAAGGLGVELCRIACGFSGLRWLKLVLDLQHCAITLAGSGSSNSANAGSSSSGSSSSSSSNAAQDGSSSSSDSAQDGSSSSSSDKGYDVLPLQSNSSSSASIVNAALQLQEQQQHIRNALRSWLCSCHGIWHLCNLAQLRVLDVTLHVPAVRVMGDLGPAVLGRCRQCGGGVGLEAVRWFFKQAVPWELPTCEVRYEEVSSTGGW